MGLTWFEYLKYKFSKKFRDKTDKFVKEVSY